MIRRAEGFEWPGIDLQTYKDEPGTWVSVSRRNLFENNETQFEVRYFEVAPHGYTSFERHAHEHCVVVIRGTGKVRLGDDWFEIGERDSVHVPPNVPHQFRNESAEPFGILCVVDKVRDRPVLLDNQGRPRPSE